MDIKEMKKAVAAAFLPTKEGQPRCASNDYQWHFKLFNKGTRQVAPGESGFSGHNLDPL